MQGSAPLFRGEIPPRSSHDDLALLYLKEGRTGEVRRIAEEMVPIFSAQDVHRKATAALLLFQDAAWREEVPAELVREVGSYLEAA